MSSDSSEDSEDSSILACSSISHAVHDYGLVSDQQSLETERYQSLRLLVL